MAASPISVVARTPFPLPFRDHYSIGLSDSGRSSSSAQGRKQPFRTVRAAGLQQFEWLLWSRSVAGFSGIRTYTAHESRTCTNCNPLPIAGTDHVQTESSRFSASDNRPADEKLSVAMNRTRPIHHGCVFPTSLRKKRGERTQRVLFSAECTSEGGKVVRRGWCCSWRKIIPHIFPGAVTARNKLRVDF